MVKFEGATGLEATMKLTTLALGTQDMSQQLAVSLDKPVLTLAMTTELDEIPYVRLLFVTVAIYAPVSPCVPEYGCQERLLLL